MALINDLASKEEPAVYEHGIALLGNGDNKPLSKDQLESIEMLYNWAIAQETKLRSDEDGAECWCDRETCRRYLVARKWKFEAAKSQLLSTLEWRQSSSGQLSTTMEFWQSPKAFENPLSLTLRIVGWDTEGRPIAYTNFAHAHDRWDIDSNMMHLTLLLEASCRVLSKRRKMKLNRTASSRQWIWVIDFDGFGIRDQNPRSALGAAKLLNWYPEMMHQAILLNAPYIFSATWRLLTPLLDNRIREKIVFISDKAMSKNESMRQRLGEEPFDWILAEARDNVDRRYDDPPKKYWAPPATPEGHDARGMKSYVNSEFYVKTPGDAWQEQQQNH